jgi:hypothetical protein
LLSYILPIHDEIQRQLNANIDISKVPKGVNPREVARVNMDASNVIPPTTARNKPVCISVIAVESPNFGRAKFALLFSSQIPLNGYIFHTDGCYPLRRLVAINFL